MTLTKKVIAVVLSTIWCLTIILWIKAGHDWNNARRYLHEDNSPEAYYP